VFTKNINIIIKTSDFTCRQQTASRTLYMNNKNTTFTALYFNYCLACGLFKTTNMVSSNRVISWNSIWVIRKFYQNTTFI